MGIGRGCVCVCVCVCVWGGGSALFFRRLNQGRVMAKAGGVKPTAVVFAL